MRSIFGEFGVLSIADYRRAAAIRFCLPTGLHHLLFQCSRDAIHE
jgi:ribosomal protein L32E